MKLKEETHGEAIRLWEALVRCEGDREAAAEAIEVWEKGANDKRRANRVESQTARSLLETTEALAWAACR